MTDKNQSRLTAVKGMNDVLPEDAALWEFFEETVRSVLHSYGYRQIRTPILEYTPLFQRGIGEVTDIVEKEMYSFQDALNGEPLSLRPEGTASVCRSVIEHNLTYEGGQRLWYQGPMFRHERPQRGRYRQFHQVGAEAIGYAGPDVDAEMIGLCARLWEAFELSEVKLEINSLGNSAERAEHRAALIAYLEKHQDALDEDGKRRLYTNPLRVLDTKHPDMQQVAQAAPKLMDYLGAESRAHFEQFQRLLKLRGVRYDINPRLVRGLDYYNLTVFEWTTTELGAQGTICGGGRYDGLIELLGGKPTPACGLALGVERVLELIRLQGFDAGAQTDVYVVHSGVGSLEMAQQVAELLRDEGIDTIVHAGGGSFKSQMKKADASGAAFAVLLGEDELKANEVSLKALRDAEGQALHGGPQERVAVRDLPLRMLEELGFGGLAGAME
ncbi:MAG: histidine--tRNA ligase [bacterium]